MESEIQVTIEATVQYFYFRRRLSRLEPVHHILVYKAMERRAYMHAYMRRAW